MNAKIPDTDFSPHYPFEIIPEPGNFMQIAKGIYWLRMPLPIYLNHINLWLLEGQDSWTIVDTGWATDENITIWEQVAVQLLCDKPVKQVVVTHMHPDHVGLAGWLCGTHQSTLCMARAEYLNCHLLLGYTHEEAPGAALNFYRAAGYDEHQLQNYQAHFGQFGQYVRNLPHSYRRLCNGDTLHMADQNWQVIIGEGHSPEHVCLYNAEQSIFISGDQLLPTISSNVSVWPTEPEADPLKDWLRSCHHLSEVIDDDVLILPAHGRPFQGGRSRLQYQIREIEEGLDKLLEFCSEPRRAVDAFEILFKSRITNSNMMMATGESLAHLHCLRERGLVTVHYRDGVGYWMSCQGALPQKQP
ncbi:MAG: MBL fold metallo-hydrolase [Thiolinea sp.]